MAKTNKNSLRLDADFTEDTVTMEIRRCFLMTGEPMMMAL